MTNLKLIQQLIIDLNNSKQNNYFQIFNSDSYNEEQPNVYELNKIDMSKEDFATELEIKGFHKFDKPVFAFNENIIHQPNKNKLNQSQLKVIIQFIKDWQMINDVITVR